MLPSNEEKRSITVFVPALNEERNLEPTVSTLLQALEKSQLDYEIIIVNDGSTDKTREIANRLASDRIKVIHHPKCLGLGRGYQTAISAATRDHFVFVPGDNQWPFDSLQQLFESLGEADVITSYAINSHIRPLERRFFSRAYTMTINLLHGLNLYYYNGLTIYPTTFLRVQPIAASGFGFAAETLLRAIYLGMSLKEIGLEIEERAEGRSKALTIRNVLSVVRSILRGFWELRAKQWLHRFRQKKGCR